MSIFDKVIGAEPPDPSWGDPSTEDYLKQYCKNGTLVSATTTSYSVYPNVIIEGWLEKATQGEHAGDWMVKPTDGKGAHFILPGTVRPKW